MKKFKPTPLVIWIGVGLVIVLALWLLTSMSNQGQVFSQVTKTLGYAPGATTAAAATTAASSSAALPTAAAGNAAPASKPQNQPAQPLDRKIIRNATLSITVADIEFTLAKFRSLATSQGGYVFQENTSTQNDKPAAQIVLQVPSQTFEDSITQIRQAATKVLSQNSTAQDVTEEYVDVSSQITNLQRTEEGLQKLLDKAQKLEDILAIQKELTSVRGEIEKRQGRIKFLDQRTTFSSITINVSLPPDVVPTKTEPKKEEGFQLDKAAGDAWNASLKVVSGVATLVVQVVVFSWWLVPFALIALAVWWMRRRSLAKNNPPSS